MKQIERILSLRWTGKLTVLCLLVAVAVWVRLLVAASSAIPALLLLGVAIAWGASMAALLTLVGAAAERVLRRGERSALLETGVAPTLLLLVGGGLVASMAPSLALSFDRDKLAVTLTGALLLVFGWWRRSRPYERITYPVMHLALAILAFTAPREAGFFSFRWASQRSSASWSWSGGDSCSGSGRAGRAATIAAHRPGYVLVDAGLSGRLGQAIARQLEAPAQGAHHSRARLAVSGQLDLGLGCHLPFYRGDTARGSLTVSTSLRLSGARPESSLRCGGSHQLLVKVSAAQIGVGSCADLTRYVARQVASQIDRRAREITGR